MELAPRGARRGALTRAAEPLRARAPASERAIDRALRLVGLRRDRPRGPGNRREAGAEQTRKRSTHLTKRRGGAKRSRRERPKDSNAEMNLWIVKRKEKKEEKKASGKRERRRSENQKPPPRLRVRESFFFLLCGVVNNAKQNTAVQIHSLSGRNRSGEQVRRQNKCEEQVRECKKGGGEGGERERERESRGEEEGRKKKEAGGGAEGASSFFFLSSLPPSSHRVPHPRASGKTRKNSPASARIREG